MISKAGLSWAYGVAGRQCFEEGRFPMHLERIAKAAFAAISLGAATVSPAWATILDITYTGTVSSAQNVGGYIGDSFTATYVFDTFH
jgi:hypothetical protein